MFLQQVKAKSLEADIMEGSTLKLVKTILSKAFDAYHSLFTAGKWHVNNKATWDFNIVCWNCEKKGSTVNKCHHPKDLKNIAINTKNFSEQEKKVEDKSGNAHIYLNNHVICLELLCYNVYAYWFLWYGKEADFLWTIYCSL